jgi:uncharacterized protein involved in exopolysaccharide biosynthesis
MQENLTTSTQEVDNKEPDFLDYLEIVAKRKKMVLKVTLAACVLSSVIVIFVPNKYAAVARFLPPQQDQGLMGLMMGSLGGGGLSSLAGSVLGTGTLADQYASILESERIKDVIIDRFKLMEEYDVDYRVWMYKNMDKIVKIKAGKKDGIITITAQSKDPQKAADIANAYIEELGKLEAELDISDAGKNRHFLEDRLTRSRADLARAEDALKAFQSKNKAIDVPSQAKASIEGVAMLKAQLAVQEAQLSALRSQFTDSTQEVQNIKATVRNLKSQIAGLEGIGRGAIPSVGSVPDLGQEQVRLLREFKTQEMIVELLTKQHELAKLTEAKDITTIQVIQKARAPDFKVKPRRKLIILFCTFLGFAGAASWALFEDYQQKMPSEEVERWRRVLSLIKEWKGRRQS